MKELQLILVQPCEELWEKMPGGPNERHCDRCQKNIVDLTSKSDAELIRFFKNKKENTCARLHSHQLRRTLVPPAPQKPSWQWLVPFAIGAAMASPAQGQTLKPVVTQSNKKPNPDPVISQSTTANQVPRSTFSGTVIDKNSREPVVGVQIRQKGFQNVLGVTDHAGRFKISVPIANVKDLFVFRSIGFDTIETLLKEGMVVKLAGEPIRLGGISAISYEKRPLYILTAGDKRCTIDEAQFSKIPTDWIERLEVLKNGEMTALYGSKAANGVILLEIKGIYVNKFDFSKEK